MEDSVAKINLKEIKNDLIRAIKECSDRGLKHTRKW